jgi:hypothetical protein
VVLPIAVHITFTKNTTALHSYGARINWLIASLKTCKLNWSRKTLGTLSYPLTNSMGRCRNQTLQRGKDDECRLVALLFQATAQKKKAATTACASGQLLTKHQ